MKTKKIIAALGALLLISLIVTLAVSFMGNPLSQWLADRRAKDYVAQTYPHLELTLTKATYNFKFSEYIVHAASPTSIDTHFALYFNSKGQFVRDDYENYVLGGFNTWQRLDTQYRALTDAVLDDPTFPYPSEIAFGSINDGKARPKLDFDKEYDMAALGAAQGIITLYINTATPSAETMAEVLTDVKKIFDAQGVAFAYGDFTLQPSRQADGTRPDGSFSIAGFSYHDIGVPDMEQKILENAKALQDYYAEQDKEKDAPQAIPIE